MTETIEQITAEVHALREDVDLLKYLLKQIETRQLAFKEDLKIT